MLLLQGKEDCQVREPDFERLRAALAARNGIPFEARLLPGLNHLFIEVEGRSTGAEYSKPGHVAEVVVESIAAWIRTVAP